MTKTFYIIDGHAHIYRAYFAPFRELASATGEPTKATYVFTQRLLNLVEQKQPHYLAMVIDSDETQVFRRAIFPQYKANRTPPGADFQPQEQRILQIVRDAGIPIFAKAGFEADDLIATMARQLRGKGFEAVIVSNDKDLRQILDANTRMYDIYEDKYTDPAALQAALGYTPAQAIEIQTLIGDSTDNVPGIPGVGPKTAVKLIAQYGTADAVLDHLDDLTPKMRENFQKYADRLPLARQLVTLKTDVDMAFDPEQCRFDGLKLEGLKPHLQVLGFHRLLEKLELEGSKPAAPLAQSHTPITPAGGLEMGLFGAMHPAAAHAPDRPMPAALALGQPLATSAGCDYRLVDTEEKLAAFLAELKNQKRFAFDTETDDLGAMRSNAVGMSFSWKHGGGFYIPIRGPAGSVHLSPQRVLDAVRGVLEAPEIAKFGHNIKYDLLVMRNAGIELRGIVMDTMVAAFLIDSSRNTYGLDPLAEVYLNFKKIPTTDLLGKGKAQISMRDVPLDRVAVYAAEDADICLRLADLLIPRLDALPEIRKLHDELETPLIDVMAEMEFNGIAIDNSVLQEQSQVISRRIDALREGIMKAAGIRFNPDSPKQLAGVLFEHLKLPAGRKTTTGYSTDVQVLEKLARVHECPRLMLEYRTLTKLKNTYLDNLPEFVNHRTGRIHPSFSQIGAETGRLSCSDPNLQNIPIRTDEGRRIRLAFVPGDRQHNVLLTADYSQIELRILAHLTGEPALLKAFDADQDIHQAVAAEVFNVVPENVTRQQRGYAKIVNFGIIYGISAWGLSERIEGLSVSAAEELIRTYHARFPSIQGFFDQCVRQARDQGYVQTIMGRRRAIPDIESPVQARRGYAERAAINSVVQGSAADLIKVAMLNVHRRLKKDHRPSKLLLQVHDELVFETPVEAVESENAMLKEEMNNAIKLKVPLKIGIGHGNNWEEGK